MVGFPSLGSVLENKGGPRQLRHPDVGRSQKSSASGRKPPDLRSPLQVSTCSDCITQGRAPPWTRMRVMHVILC